MVWAAWLWRSQAATLGIRSRAPGCSRPFIAPQSEWPHTTMSRTPSAITAYSMAAETPPVTVAIGGTMLPALRHTNSSPGPTWVICSGTTRESAHEITSAFGCWPSWTRR